MINESNENNESKGNDESIEGNEKTAKQNSITAEQVEQYLQQNSDFFDKHPEFLAELNVKHQSGPAVSLIERQVSVLRDKNKELHTRLNELVDTARDNDRLFDLTQRLILALLECNELGDLVDALYFSFDKEFNIHFTQLILFQEDLPSSNAQIKPLKEGEAAIAKYLQFGQTVCGGLEKETIEYLFPETADKIGSAAISPLISGSQLLGVLAIGNECKNYYQSSTGSLFLSHISNVLTRLMRPYFKDL